MTNNTIEEILSTMRTKRFALEVLNAVESTAGYHFYSLYKLGGAKTVREWGELAEDDPSQRTSQITVRVCHDFEYAIANVTSMLPLKQMALCWRLKSRLLNHRMVGQDQLIVTIVGKFLSMCLSNMN